MKEISTVKSTSGWLRTLRQINALLRPLEFTEKRSQQYGDFYQITFKDSPPTIITSNPKAIKDILTTAPNKFDVGKSNKSLSFLLGDNSLLLLDGRKHRERRHLLMPHFHGESLQKCSEQIIEITNKVCDHLDSSKPFKVRTLTQEITMRVILSVVFGVDSGARYDHLQKLLTKLLDTFNNPLNSSLIFFPVLQKDLGKLSPWGKFLRLQKEIKALINAEIRIKRELLASSKSPRNDILSQLLLAKDEHGVSMTDAELHDELITLLFAGHETTASALAWIFYWVHYHPEIEQKLRFELDELNQNLDYQTINNCLYLKAIVSETLRIYPIAAATFPRILNTPVSVMEYDLEPDTWLIISIYALHHREDLYANSKQFNPQRFLQQNYSNYEYIPFGGGNRRCIGSALALLEMKLVTATILQRFKLELTRDRHANRGQKQMSPVRRGLTLAPPASFKMNIKNQVA